ncbi:DUF6710 family protein [Paenibacillus sp. MMS20-IR301]|uniref:DUF6710 family protein n=1 Tax=Paenibacillus sp. MMS20-IR301 TaxID=2895946 RepID=UPI0028E66CAA|nr:DUF6710 family protein [Paenibacillus sp. MMS20-IR301]WNS43185.1 DUF6710 family protein [Paenibacillus sp. MMS20-IR301]
MNTKQDFDHLMAFAKDLINENLGFYYDINYGYFQPETHPIIDFIRLIGRRIQSELMLAPVLHGEIDQLERIFSDNLFFDEWAEVTPGGQSFHFLMKPIDDNSKAIHLSRDLVFPSPWIPRKLRDSLIRIGEGTLNGGWRQDAGHQVILWLPLGIAFVEGSGHHSVTAGIAKGEGDLYPTSVFDISPIYDHVYTDGKYYYRRHDQSVISEVMFAECAAIFEIGRMMIEQKITF